MQLRNKMIITGILVLLALVSIFGVSKVVASPKIHTGTIQALDDKRDTVMRLTAASTTASVAVTMLPGDVATPVAEKLADLSSYFLLVLSAIYLEKYLVTITGYIAFVYLVPAACGCMILYLFWGKEAVKQLCAKLLVFAFAICLIIPFSVRVSNLIEQTYDTSIEQTIEAAQQAAQDIPETTASDQEKEESGLLSGLISQVTEGVSNAVSGAVEKFENTLNRFIEALAVMIVTSCIIPILILGLFVWLGNSILGLNVPMPKKVPAILSGRKKGQ